jgi:hypothetical protein
MEFQIHRLDKVYTADDVHLGEAIAIYKRQDEVNPGLELYAAYLKIFSFEMGDDFYVPTDFIASRDAENGTVKLSIDMHKVKHETFERMPNFVAYEQGIVEELPTG